MLLDDRFGLVGGGAVSKDRLGYMVTYRWPSDPAAWLDGLGALHRSFHGLDQPWTWFQLASLLWKVCIGRGQPWHGTCICHLEILLLLSLLCVCVVPLSVVGALSTSCHTYLWSCHFLVRLELALGSCLCLAVVWGCQHRVGNPDPILAVNSAIYDMWDFRWLRGFEMRVMWLFSLFLGCEGILFHPLLAHHIWLVTLHGEWFFPAVLDFAPAHWFASHKVRHIWIKFVTLVTAISFVFVKRKFLRRYLWLLVPLWCFICPRATFSLWNLKYRVHMLLLLVHRVAQILFLSCIGAFLGAWGPATLESLALWRLRLARLARCDLAVEHLHTQLIWYFLRRRAKEILRLCLDKHLIWPIKVSLLRSYQVLCLLLQEALLRWRCYAHILPLYSLSWRWFIGCPRLLELWDVLQICSYVLWLIWWLTGC